MPKDGDTIKGYCGKCNKETTWVYMIVPGGGYNTEKHYWVCLGCDTKRSAHGKS